MIYFALAAFILAGSVLWESIAQRRAHEQLEAERRTRYMQRFA